jgi:Helix-turn-helix domain
MSRPERPIDPRWPLAFFAGGLRALRRDCGLSYRDMAQVTFFGVSTLSVAAGGERLPSLEVTLAYVRACGGSQEEWERRWHRTHDLLHAHNGKHHG